VQVLIIGNGIAGVTTALALRKRRRDWGITLVSGESDTFFSRTALMYVFMGQLRLEDTQPYEPHVWREKRIERVRGWVSGIDVAARRVHLDDGRTLAWDKLVLATGSTPNRFGWPGERLEGVQGLYTLQDLETLERSVGGARRAVVVGGGLIGVELAEMLHTRGLPVTLLARESAYWNNALPGRRGRAGHLGRPRGGD
jgi:NADPH-dependent 2,4-dienoyl-CoA reductase/sulfur reductase-like enzyme